MLPVEYQTCVTCTMIGYAEYVKRGPSLTCVTKPVVLQVYMISLLCRNGLLGYGYTFSMRIVLSIGLFLFYFVSFLYYGVYFVQFIFNCMHAQYLRAHLF